MLICMHARAHKWMDGCVCAMPFWVGPLPACSWNALMALVMAAVAVLYPLGVGYSNIRASASVLGMTYAVSALYTLDILYWCRCVHS